MARLSGNLFLEGQGKIYFVRKFTCYRVNDIRYRVNC